MRRSLGLTALLLILGNFGPAFARPAQDLMAAFLRQDYAGALRLLGPLAEHGDKWAQFQMGEAYEYGLGVAANAASAYGWYRKAAEQGLAEAQYKVGILSESGSGTTQDVVEAIRWYRKAADQGDVDAEFKLGRAYELGTGVAKDPAESTRWYLKSAAHGDGNPDAF